MSSMIGREMTTTVVSPQQRLLVRGLAEQLRERMADAQPWQLEASRMLCPLQGLVAHALTWSLEASDVTRELVDLAEDQLEQLPLGDLAAWQLRLVRLARRLRAEVDGVVG
jgi:hypothetical protein